MNGDGRNQIVCVNNNKAEIRIYEFRDTQRVRNEVEDYEDINRLNFSRFFSSQTVPVRSRIQSLAAGDVNSDGQIDGADIEILMGQLGQKAPWFSEIK